ncbi:MAG: ABC transporter permease, partial [Gemmatimonadota bacterium]
ATAQCGACVNGGLPAPFWGVVADHHAVAPGYFLATGTRVVAGRTFDLGDGADAPRVAVINRTFANTAFEKGDPLGHLIRLGSNLDAWYEVVGVVEDTDPAALGRDDRPRSAVYLSALQHPLTRAEVLLRGDEDAVAAALDALSAAGYRPGAPLTLARLRDREAAPLRWVGRLALVLGLLTLLLAMHGGYATALQVTRRRVRELGVRRVLGADDRRIVRLVLVGSARTALFGGALAAFFGALAVAFLRKSAGGVPPLGPGAYLGITALLVGAALLASIRAAREAMTVAPGIVLE